MPLKRIVTLLAALFCLTVAGCATRLPDEPTAPPAPPLTKFEAAQLKQADAALYYLAMGQYPEFHPGVAYTSAAFSQLAYLPEKDARACLAQHGFKLLRYFDLQPADYQFFVAKGSYNSRPVYIVSIRGSDSSEDWVTNMQLANRKLKDLTIPGKVHQGFLGYAEAVYNSIAWDDATRPMLYQLTSGKADILVTGHSLGGAVALIYSTMLRSIGVTPEHMQTYTFGAPAVGDKAFAATNDNGKIFRVELAGDPVPFAASISPWLYERAKRNQDDGTDGDTMYESQFMHIGKSYTFDPAKDGYTIDEAGPGSENKSFAMMIANNLLALYSSKYDVVEHDIATYMNILNKHLQSEEGQRQMSRLEQP